MTRTGAGTVCNVRPTSPDGGWSRRHVLFTVFGDARPFNLRPWHEHRVQLVTSDAALKVAAGARFRVRDGVRGTWRIETSRKDYDEGLGLRARSPASPKTWNWCRGPRLTPDKAFSFMPLSHIHPGMVVPVYKDGRVVESTVAAVEWEDYEGPVYDLSVPHTRNYVAGGVVVHNSIYAWRGADIKNILEFERDYPDAKVVKLEQNYRSTKTILAVASKLIANNTQRKEKALWTDNPQGEPADVLFCQDERDEADAVMRRLRAFNEKQGVPWSDMAIFYRMNSLSRVMEEALFKNKVPYQIARGVEFYNRKEIKDVLAYLRVVANPADEVSLSRIANVPPRGLGDATLKQLTAYATGHGITLVQAMDEAPLVTGLSTKAVAGAKKFVDLLRHWRRLAGVVGGKTGGGGEGERGRQGDKETGRQGEGGETMLQFVEPAAVAQAGPAPRRPVQAVMEDVIKSSGYSELLKKLDKEKEEGERPSDNVNELISSAAEFDRDNAEGTLQEYLANVSLVSDADHMRGAGGAVTLMTLHAAKGLEFPVVAMIGMEDGVLPHSRARDNVDEMEEERRLCFVGITRAQRHLILSKAQYRTVRGLRERTITSPFLNEMPPDLLKVEDRTGVGSLDTDSYPSREEPKGLAAQFHKGQLVRHPTFGLGRITEVADMGQHTRAVIEFNSAGRKTLILQYAKLEAVG